MAARRVFTLPALVIAIGAASCSGGGAAPSVTGAASAAPSAVASQAPIPIITGRLEAGTTYLLSTSPVLSLTPPDGWSASETTGGVQLISGRNTVRMTSGHDGVYVGMETVEPIATDIAGIIAQVQRNRQFEVGDAVTTEIAGLTARYVDADVIYENNTEGGAALLISDQSRLFIADDSLGRLYIVEGDDGPIFITATGFGPSGRDALLDPVEALLATLAVVDS